MSRLSVVVIGLGFLLASCSVETLDVEHQAAAETALIQVSPRASAISEAGDSAFVRIALTRRPHGAVTIGLSSSVPSETQIVPDVVVFRPDDWSEPRTVQISAVDDAAFDGDIPLTITLTVATHDHAYADVRPAPIDVLSVDDDYVITGYRTRLVAEASRESRVVGINNRGQVAGDFETSDGTIDPFLWDNGVLTDLGSLGGGRMQSHALGLNDSGTVVGWSDTINGVTWFRYDDQVVALPGQAWAINDRGHIAGDALYADGQRTELHGGEPVTALAINNRDHVAGLFPTPPYYERAFFWNGQFIDLGSFGDPRAAGTGVNERDQVVGRRFDAQFNYQAFLYDGGAIVDLGTATGSAGGVANGINNRGDIVGTDNDSGRQPVMGWIGRPGALTSLQSLLVDGSCFLAIDALAVNDSGAIAARALACDVGSFRAYLFEPIKAAR